MASLEEQVEEAFVELAISEENRASIKNYLSLLKAKGQVTYEHSIRVGLLGARVARHMHLDAKALFFAGALHDLGKALIEPEVLKKTEGFNSRDMKKMEKHPEYTYQLLRGVHEFSAEIALRHHRYQENGYPKSTPKPKIPFQEGTKATINFYARMLALVDFYDALTTRKNDKFTDGKKLTHEEAKSIILMRNKDQRHLIEDFYANGIFGDEIVEESAEDDKKADAHDALYDSIWQGWDGKRNPKETRRFVTLACALEPLSEKIGCTTRATNSNQYQKLEYFITGAVNIGDAFEELAERILSVGAQPRIIYDLAHKAQADCKKNRSGGRVNQGIIELLTPIIAAQMIYDPDYKLQAQDVLAKTKDVMLNTSPADVVELMKMKRLAYDLSGYADRPVPEHPDAKNVYDYYLAELRDSGSVTSIKHNSEFVLGFPAVQMMYDLVVQSRRRSFNRRVEGAYSLLRAGMHKDVAPGLTADCAATAIYLIFSHHPKDKIVR